MDIPQIDKATANELLETAKVKAINASSGKFTQLGEDSPLSAILEAVSVVGSTVINSVNSLAGTLEENRITYFGVERIEGKASVGTVRVNLTGVYAESFSLPEGFKFTCNDVEFQLTQSLTIAPYQLSGTATAISLTIGEETNVSGAITYSPVPKVSSLEWEEDPTGGQNAEGDEEWENRIVGTLRRRQTLISEDDFEDAVINYLGVGSVALAVGRLKPNLMNYENGYVAVFGLNPDGSELTDAQKSYLEGFLNRRAVMAQVNVFSVNTVPIEIKIIAGHEDTAEPSTVATEIAAAIRNYLKPGGLSLGTLIFNKAIERRVMNISGVVDGNVSVTLNGLAQPLSLPNSWSVGNIDKLEITLVNDGIENEYIDP